MQDEQPLTRSDFEAFKQEIRQEIREQITEEMKASKVIIVSEDALKAISDKLDQQSKRFDRIDELLLAHSKSISALQTGMATKEHIDKRFDAIAEVQKQILDRLPPKE